MKRHSRFIRYLLALAAVTVTYAAAIQIGLAIPFSKGDLSPFWPPAAVSLTMLLLFGVDLWPAVFLTDLTVIVLFHHYPLKDSLAFAVADTIEPVVSVMLIRTLGDFDPGLRRVRDVVAWIFFGGLAGTTVGAAFWIALRRIAFGLTISGQLHAGFMYMRGNFVSVVLLGPLLMVWSRRFRSGLVSRRLAEAVIAFASLVIVAVLIFRAPQSSYTNGFAVEHLVVPFVIWLALRFDTHGATLGVYTTALIAVKNTILGTGPFAREGLFGLHVFLAVLSVNGLIIAASICEYRQLATDLRENEERLMESEERYRDLFENAEDFIVTLDVEGRFTSVNNATLRVSGYSREEFLGLKLHEVITAGSANMALAAFQQVISGQRQGRQTIYEMVSKNGRTLSVEVNSRPLVKDGVTVGIQTIGRDVSWRQRLESGLLQAQKMEAIGRLAGGVAHDFNNLLGVIIGYSELILADLLPSDRLTHRILEITKAGKRAADVTRQLLAFSRKQVLQTKIVDLNSIVSETTRMLLRLLGEDIELATNLRSLGAHVETDPCQMQQVLMNLAINARDAMPRGGKLIIETATAELHSESGLELVETLIHRGAPVKPGSYVVLSVTDTGVGMDEQTRARIFEPFFTTKAPGEGTGLGLSTVYGFVKQSGGYIWVYSEVGQGSTFKVYLPEVPSPGANHDPDQEPALPHGKETILLVEDEHSLRELNHELLKSLGYDVLTAAFGAQALEVAAKCAVSIDLLLTDVVMPGMSGRELAERFTLIRPETKVLYMSGYTDSVIVQHGILHGGVAFLQKPFTRSALAKKLRDVLGSRKNLHEREE